MLRLILSVLLLVGAMSTVMQDADAQRMGRRGSIGRQSGNVTRQAPAATPAARPAAGATALPAKPPSPWKGIVGGLIGGAILASLFHSMGFGGMSEGMGSFMTLLLFAGLLYMAYRMFRNRMNPSAPGLFNSMQTVPNQTAPSNSMFGSAPSSNSVFSPAPSVANVGAEQNFGATPTWALPADFDVNGFLRIAKSNYLRLQAAWDRADINDIREFTSPEMFAELRLQLQERGAAKNVTDVVTLDAELLGIETQSYDYLASVKFTGVVKEGDDPSPQNFAEVWNLAKPVNGSGNWMLAGIQHLN